MSNNRCCICGRRAEITIADKDKQGAPTYSVCSYCNGKVLGRLYVYEKWFVLNQALPLFEKEKNIHRPFLINVVRGKYTLQEARRRTNEKNRKLEGRSQDIFDVGRRVGGSFRSKQ